ncbi:MAG TPA: 3-hydroxyacyl-CoA dehydrogenase family protein [Gemmatimonadales bacterium]|nr:3-hydroxyacyl-CoA dehydrogenase family protein [Gemmatimonadales bacterium]
MSTASAPRVAVIGAGDIGCGWAALAASAGWPVALYDAETAPLEHGTADVRRRVDALVGFGRADPLAAQSGLGQLRQARSLLTAVQDADWIIEAASEDLGVKQRLLEQIEKVARLAAVVTSSAGTLHASQLCGRLRRADRLLVARPLTPVELLPVVEVVPGPHTDPDCVEDVRWWLTRLGRAPIVLRREVTGHVVSRLVAAVWRESIQLILDDVIDPRDLDRAIALGPALGWAAGGPALSARLAAGDNGVGVFVDSLAQRYESVWASLATWDRIDAAERARFARAIERAYANVEELRRQRDDRLARLLEAAGSEPAAGEHTI